MKILVPCKRVSDPENANKVKVSSDGSKIDTAGVEHKPNPFDDWAIEAALRLTENAPKNERIGEVVVVSIGPSDAAQQIRAFLAMGAERGILVEGDDEQLDSWIVARVFQKLVEREKPDLVMLGKQSADGESGAVGPFLAELLGWPMATQAQSIQTDDGGKTLAIGREIDGGLIKLKITAPAVITVADRIVRPDAVKNGVTPAAHAYPESDSGRYASLKGIMAAKKKPIEQLKLADLGVDTKLSSHYTGYTKPPERSGQTKFVENVQELVQKLRSEAKVL